MSHLPIPERLFQITQATRSAIDDLEHATEAEQRRRSLDCLRASFAALRQVETQHLEPLLLNQAATRHQALAYRKAEGRIAPMVEELERTEVTDPKFERLVRRVVVAVRRLMDRNVELLSGLDRLLSPEHRRLLGEALDQAAPMFPQPALSA